MRHIKFRLNIKSNHLIKTFFVVFLVVSWLIAGWPGIQVGPNFRFPPKVEEAQALDAANGDGLILYGISANTTPQWRTYSGAGNSFGAQTGTVTGGTGLNFVVKTSPTKQEAIAGYVNSSGVLQVMCYDGTSWSNEWSVTAGGTGTTRRFDIAYETNTGDALIAYTNNGATIGYRTKAGSSSCGSANWSTANTFTPARTTGTVNWIRLEASPVSSSNVIFIAWEDSTGALSAQSWSGTAWNSNEPSAAFSTNIENTGTTGNSLSFDIAVESQTGNAIIVFSPNNTTADSCTAGTNCIQYSRYTTSWSAVAGIPTVADPATNVDLAANPNTNEMVLGAIDNTSADLSLAYWSGSAWTGKANQDTAAAAPVAGTKLVACGWLISGATTRSVCTYNDSGTTNIGWVVGSGGTFTTQTDFTPTPSFGNPQKWYDIQTDPFNKDRLIFSLSDVNNDLFAKRLIMTSTPAFTWTNADGGAALQASLPGAIAQPFSFAYWRLIPTPTFNQSAYRLFNNTDSTDVGSALAAQDTAATLGSTGAAFRLRMLLHIGANQLAASGQTFKLQFAQQSGTCDTAFVGETYSDVTAATVIAYNDNATPADGATLTANASDPTHGADTIVDQTYEELNNFTNSVAAIPSGQDGKWDFSLKDNGATANTTYCLRVVKSDGSLLDTYTVIPQITTAASASTSFTQNDFKWFIDEASVSLTDAWPSGSLDLGENEVFTQLPAVKRPLSSGDKIRIQINITVGGSNLSSGSQAFQLEYVAASDCTTASGWSAVGAIGSGTIWRFFDNASLTDGITQVNQISTSTSGAEGRYLESNSASWTNPNPVNVGQSTEWDFAVENNGASENTTYCFRVAKYGGAALDVYNSDSYPKLTTAPGISSLMRHGNFFQEEAKKGFYWAD